MKQWRLLTMVVVSALTILLFVQLGSFTFTKGSTAKGNRNKSEASFKNEYAHRVEESSSSSSPTNNNFSRKLQNIFHKKLVNKSLDKIKDYRVKKVNKHTHFCWEDEEVTEIGECIHCSSYEKRVSQVCLLTGNKQLVSCKVSKKKVYKSCPHVRWIEDRNFWTFQGVSCVLLLVSSISMWQRNKKLDAIYREKLKKKVSNDNV